MMPSPKGFLVIGLGLAACNGQRTPAITETVLTPPGVSAASADPALALEPGTGELLISWVGAESDSAGWSLYFARSADAGTTWTSPVVVASGGSEVHPHGESSPRLVAATGGRIAVSWTNNITVPGRKWPATHMRFSRSLDGGRTWSPPITLNDDTTQALVSHQFHGAAWSGDSGLVVTWLDERKGPALEAHHGDHAATAGDITEEPDAMIYLASSPDFGRTWRANAPLWGQACPCCRVSLARGSGGEIMSAWRKHFPGNIRDVVTAPVGTDSLAEPARVHRDDWVYPGCPHTGPAISIGTDGASHVSWYVGKEGDAGVYYQRVARGSVPPAAPMPLVRARTLPTAHGSIAALPGGGALAAFDIDPAGDRAILVSLVEAGSGLVSQKVLTGSAGGLYPQTVALGGGSAVVAWTAIEGDTRRVRLARITFQEAGAGAAYGSMGIWEYGNTGRCRPNSFPHSRIP